MKQNINMNDFLHLVVSLLVDRRAAVEVRTNEVKHQHEQFPTSRSLVAGGLESCCRGENK